MEFETQEIDSIVYLLERGYGFEYTLLTMFKEEGIMGHKDSESLKYVVIVGDDTKNNAKEHLFDKAIDAAMFFVEQKEKLKL